MASKLLLLLLLLLILTTAASAAAATNSTDFIRLRCSATLHPSLCFHSLSHYISSSSPNHPITSVRLAYLATNLTLVRLRSLSSLISLNSSFSSSLISLNSSSSYVAALSDCRECLGDAVDQVAQSADEIGRIEKAAAGAELGWRVSNALTWISAALTNEDTCADSLDQARGVVRRGDPCWRIHRAMAFTSNALALVNSLVN